LPGIERGNRQLLHGQRERCGRRQTLREQGIEIVDLHSQECLDLIGKFQKMRPDLWKECIGEA
jgi:hypothetical protein